MAFLIYDSFNDRMVAILQEDRQVRVIESLPAVAHGLYAVAMEPGADYFEHWNVLRDTLRMVLRYICTCVKYILPIRSNFKDG